MNIFTFKAVWINSLWGKFLEDATAVLVKFVSEICSLLVVFKFYPPVLELTKLRFLSRKLWKVDSYRIMSWLQPLSKTTERVVHNEATIL